MTSRALHAFLPQLTYDEYIKHKSVIGDLDGNEVPSLLRQGAA